MNVTNNKGLNLSKKKLILIPNLIFYILTPHPHYADRSTHSANPKTNAKLKRRN